MRRLAAVGQRIGQGGAHVDRRIVQQNRHGCFHAIALFRRQRGMQV